MMNAHTAPAHTSPRQTHGRIAVSRWRTVNISPAERAGRIALGLAAIIAGMVLLAAAGSAPAAVFEALLIAAGLDLVVTGASGHCPLYQKLGHIPRSLRSPR